MTRPLIIYHGNCADGFTAAWVTRKRFTDADFHPGVYQDPPPDVSGREVYLVDFSYKRPVLENMIAKAKRLVVIDHHKTAAADLAFLMPCATHDALAAAESISGGMAFALFDMERSGARLAWDFFHPSDPVPQLVRYVEDRDLWRFGLPNSREVNAWIFSNEYSFEHWDRMSTYLVDDLDGAVMQGAAIERKHHKDVGELVATLKRRMAIGGVEVWAANLPYTLTSDAGHLMAQGEPFAACYWDTAEGRVFSLRSSDDGADVSAIAAKYGGGGHARAAGFRLPHGVAP